MSTKMFGLNISRGNVQELNKLRKKAGYKMDFSVSRHTGVVTISDEEAQRLWEEEEADNREKSQGPLQGVKKYNITALVEEIYKEDGLTETQKKEIKEIQQAKQEMHMNPGRRAMIEGEQHHTRLRDNSYRPGRDRPTRPDQNAQTDPSSIQPHAFLNAAIASGRKKFEQAQADAARAQERRCNEHRTSHDNILTAVPLCPHIDMRLFWFADDPANKKNSWLFDISEVHAQDVAAHEACKGKIRGVMDGLDDIVKQVSSTMERRNLRAPNVNRMIRQLPAVLALQEIDEVNVNTVKKVDPADVEVYAKGWQRWAKQMEQRREKIAKVVGSKTEEEKVAKEAGEAAKKAGKEPKNRFKLSEMRKRKKGPVKVKTTTEKTTAKTAAPGRPTAEEQPTSKMSKLSEEIIYDSDEVQSDDGPINLDPEQKEDILKHQDQRNFEKKRRALEESNVSDETPHPLPKKRRVSSKETEIKKRNEEAPQPPTSAAEAATPDVAEPFEPGKSAIADVDSSESNPSSDSQAAEQPTSSKKRAYDEMSEAEVFSVKKRKISIVVEETEGANTAVIETVATNTTISETAPDTTQQPTPVDTEPATPSFEGIRPLPISPLLALDTVVTQPLTPSSSLRSSKSVHFPEEVGDAEEVEDSQYPKSVSPVASPIQQGSVSPVCDNERMEDQVDYDSDDE